jgi:YidC/Oxa1 family membrane protein insertase
MLDPLYTAISWLLLKWHSLWADLVGADSGIAWGLAIVFLVITIRVVLFPLFVKQIKSQRAMQDIAPKIKEVREKYKNDRETQQREMMALYKEHGANPITGCLPIILQAPVFFALYHVLKRLAPGSGMKTLYGWTANLFDSAAHARIIGAPISAHFTQAFTAAGRHQLDVLNASAINVALVTGALVVIMVSTTYITQRQMIARQKASGQAVDKQQQMTQRMMLFAIPAVLLFTGTSFPLGVVIYWCTTNVWSMGQQFYVLHRMPHPGQVQAGPKQPELAKALAPKPGVKPVNPKKGPTASAERPAPQRANTPEPQTANVGAGGRGGPAPTKSGKPGGSSRPPTNRSKKRKRR